MALAVRDADGDVPALVVGVAEPEAVPVPVPVPVPLPDVLGVWLGVLGPAEDGAAGAVELGATLCVPDVGAGGVSAELLFGLGRTTK